MTTPREDAHRYDHDGMHRHHHDADSGDVIWWERADQFGGDFREHRHDQSTPREDARPSGEGYEIRQWVKHEPSGVVVLVGHPQLGGRYCTTDGGDWPCAAVRAALAADAETADQLAGYWERRAKDAEARLATSVDLTSPETAEALAQKLPGAIAAGYSEATRTPEAVVARLLAAMRETGR